MSKRKLAAAAVEQTPRRARKGLAASPQPAKVLLTPDSVAKGATPACRHTQVRHPCKKEVLAATTALRQSTSAPQWAVAGLEHITAADSGRLLAIVEEHGPPSYLMESPAYADGHGACAGLCRIIVGQQLAGKAAQAIWARTREALQDEEGAFTCDAVVAKAVGGAFPDNLRGQCGLSKAKARAVLGVCTAFASGELTDALLRSLDVDTLRAKLTSLNGVGPWSCDMYMIFHLKVADVLPLGDLGVRAGAQKAFSLRGAGKNGALDMKKDARLLEQVFEPYKPYRSLAAYYMWRVADTKAFNQNT